MGHRIEWNATYEAVPKDNDYIPEGAQRIRNLKRDTRETFQQWRWDADADNKTLSKAVVKHCALKQVTGEITGVYTVDAESAHVFNLTLTGDVVLSLTGANPNGLTVLWILATQDNTGTHDITFDTTINWAYSLTPEIYTSGNTTTVYCLYTLDGSTWYGSMVGTGYAEAS